MTRRAFLFGTGCLAASGTAAIYFVGPRKVLHQVGLVESPDHHVPPSGWPVVEHSLSSAAMQRSVLWAIARPPTGSTTGPTTNPAGVIVCLHGRDNDHRFAFDDIHVHDIVAALGLSFAVVSIDGGADSYWHPRADGTNALSMVVDELYPAIDAELGLALPRAVMGWSMGGYGALLAAEHAPQSIRAVVAASPALWPSFENASKGAFDSAADFAANNVDAGVASLSSLVVRVDCGTDDGFIDAARGFAERLPVANPGGFHPGFHDESYWRSIAPAQITTIAAALTT